MNKELYINLGFVGHNAEIFQKLFKEYSPEPNQYGRFLRFENYSELANNLGVMCHTNCFENKDHFNDILHGKLIWNFLENSEKNY